MNFRAVVKTPSELHSRWTRERRIGGVISGVRFQRLGKSFISVDDPLNADDVAALLTHNMVVLEFSTVRVGEVVARDPAPNSADFSDDDPDAAVEPEPRMNGTPVLPPPSLPAMPQREERQAPAHYGKHKHRRR